MELKNFNLEKSYELHCPNLLAWKIECNKNIWESTDDSHGFILTILEMSYDEWKEISNKYPLILLTSELITKKSNIQDFIFFPTFEFADNEECYISNMDKNEILKVIIYADLISKEETQIKFKEKHIQKTYLMIDGHGFIKIGKSFNPGARECTLQSKSSQIKLLCIVEKNIEKILHNEYSKYRVRGEWFKLNQTQLLKIIKDNGFVKQPFFKHLIRLN